MDTYVRLATEHPFLTAFVQFLVLGTLGEVLSSAVRTGVWRFPFSPAKAALKALGWGALGLYVKVMFLVGDAGVRGLVVHGDLPSLVLDRSSLAGLVLGALVTSTLVNVMLGPSMMLLHRLTDIGIDRLLGDSPVGWAGIGRALGTLLWLWIPLHTFTFTQPPALRVGIAAVLSLVLGLVMGWFARRAAPAVQAA